MLELDPRPLAARRAPEPPPPLLLQMMRGFLWVAALASLAGALLLAAVLLFGRANTTSTARALGWGFVAVFVLMAFVAAAATRLRDVGLPRALTALLALLVLGGVGASLLLGRA